MKDGLFTELVASVREAGAILRGETVPARAFQVVGVDIKQIRADKTTASKNHDKEQ